MSFPLRRTNGVPLVPSSRCGPAVAPCRVAISFSCFRTGPGSRPRPTTQLPMTVFASAPGHAARLAQDWIPGERALAIGLEAMPTGGSVILPEATGHLPGLKGRLSPVRDAHDRTCLYASNIAIDDGKQRPVHFIPGEELQLTDAKGAELHVQIVGIAGWSVPHDSRIQPGWMPARS